MKNKQSQQEFIEVWQKLSKPQQNSIFIEVHKIITANINSGKLQVNFNYDWKLCIAFDKIEPHQYLYAEGMYEVDYLKNITIQTHYLEISDNADLFLDKRTELIGIIEEQKIENNIIPEKKIVETPIENKKDVIQSHSLDEDIYQFVKTLDSAQLKKLVTYNDAKELFFENKIAELKKLIY